MRDELAGLTDAQILERAGGMGPAIIGQTLYDRAEEIRKRTSGGVLGPAIVGPATPVPTPAPEAQEPAAWDDLPRNKLLAIAREQKVDVRSNYTKDELIDALVAASINPQDVDPDDG
jgi:hypothetical protein